jgi:hypothetical protein
MAKSFKQFLNENHHDDEEDHEDHIVDDDGNIVGTDEDGTPVSPDFDDYPGVGLKHKTTHKFLHANLNQSPGQYEFHDDSRMSRMYHSYDNIYKVLAHHNLNPTDYHVHYLDGDGESHDELYDDTVGGKQLPATKPTKPDSPRGFWGQPNND